MIILAADDNALSRELIRELLEDQAKPGDSATITAQGVSPQNRPQVAEECGFRQIFWYRITLTDLHAQRPLQVFE